MATVPLHAYHPRDLGPPTPSERTIIARILIRHGYSVPTPPEAKWGMVPRRTW